MIIALLIQSGIKISISSLHLIVGYGGGHNSIGIFNFLGERVFGLSRNKKGYYDKSDYNSKRFHHLSFFKWLKNGITGYFPSRAIVRPYDIMPGRQCV
jgi:hypothetical protein